MSIFLPGGVNLGTRRGIKIGSRGGAAPDPLAGIVFQVRLQTTSGGSNPVGIYKDVLCTTPATIAGDLCAGFRDDLASSSVIYSQPTSLLRPSLQFVNGKAVLRSNGSNNSLVGPIISPVVIFALVKSNNPTSFGRVFAMSSGGSAVEHIPSTAWRADFETVQFGMGASTGAFDIIEAQGSPGASYVAVNGVVTPIADSEFNPGFIYTIFDFVSGGTQTLDGDLKALFVGAAPSAPYSPTDTNRIRDYLNLLKP